MCVDKIELQTIKFPTDEQKKKAHKAVHSNGYIIWQILMTIAA